MLKYILDMHPQIAVMPEYDWFARWFEERSGVTPEGFVTPALVTRLLRHHRLFRDVDLGIPPEQLFAMVGSGQQLLYADFVAFLFNRYSNRYSEIRGKPLVGNKTPSFVRRFYSLHSLWPHAKFVHIIRDGRDVYLSVINWKNEAKLRARYSIWERHGRHRGPVVGVARTDGT